MSIGPWAYLDHVHDYLCIHSFSFSEDQAVSTESRKKTVNSTQMDLYLKGALMEVEKCHACVQHLLSALRYTHSISPVDQSEFIQMLYFHAKSSKGRSILPALQPVFQSLPTTWVIDLSEGKTSPILEIMRLQTCKKPVELRGQTEDENELKNVLECLPFITQLR